MMLMLFVAAGSAGGCEGIRLLPKVYAAPEAVVRQVQLTERSAEGTAVRIVLDVTNPNDEQLPMKIARYRLTLGGQTYVGNTPANAISPAEGTVTFTLPAAVPTTAGTDYKLTGQIEFQPPGQLRDLITDFGVPLPTIALNSTGQLVGEPILIDPPTLPAALNE